LCYGDFGYVCILGAADVDNIVLGVAYIHGFTVDFNCSGNTLTDILAATGQNHYNNKSE
jgi:hypothetical protein